jgi:hypothetical protein
VVGREQEGLERVEERPDLVELAVLGVVQRLLLLDQVA